jgi:uncharacterized membrane protein YoaK (UPF0700 family)
MQNTRLNTLLDAIGQRLSRPFRNSWRRLSLLVISLLLGFFLASVISTISGQATYWDVSIAAILVVLAEFVSRITYSSQQRSKELGVAIANTIKIGLIYGLFLEAFKLGS